MRWIFLLFVISVWGKSVLHELSSSVLTIPMSLYHGVELYTQYETHNKLKKINPILNKSIKRPWKIDIVGISRTFGSSPDWDHLFNVFGNIPFEITIFASNVPPSYCVSTTDSIDVKCSFEKYRIINTKRPIPDFVFFANADIYDLDTPAIISYLLDRNVPFAVSTPDDAWCGYPQSSSNNSPPSTVFPKTFPYKPRDEHFSESDMDNKCIGLRELLSFNGARFLTPFKMNRNPYSTVHANIFSKKSKGSDESQEDAESSLGPDGYLLPPPSVLQPNYGKSDAEDGQNSFIAVVRGRSNLSRTAYGWKSGLAFVRARYIRDFVQNQLQGARQMNEDAEMMLDVADEVEAEVRSVSSRLRHNELTKQILAEIRAKRKTDHQKRVDNHIWWATLREAAEKETSKHERGEIHEKRTVKVSPSSYNGDRDEL